jgi:PilZ domain
VKADLSLEGARFTLPSPPPTQEMEVRFRLPEVKDEVRLVCKVQRTEAAGKETSVHVRFGDLDVRTELALARLLDFEERLEESLSEDGEG